MRIDWYDEMVGLERMKITKKNSPVLGIYNKLTAAETPYCRHESTSWCHRAGVFSEVSDEWGSGGHATGE